MRWNQVSLEERKEKAQSLEIPSKLNVSKICDAFTPEQKKHEDTEKELDGVRASRSTPLNQRWKPQERVVTRSRSSHPIGRLKLPDNCWVLERPSSLVLEEEKEKRLQELLSVKQARLDQAEILELDRPSSRLEFQEGIIKLALKTASFQQHNDTDEFNFLFGASAHVESGKLSKYIYFKINFKF